MRQSAVVLLAVLATGPPAVAETQSSLSRESRTAAAIAKPGDARTVSEEEFLGPLLQADSPWVRSLRETLGARRADLAQAKVLDQPEVDASLEDLGDGGSETEVGVSWRLPRPDRRRLDVERAVGELTAAQSSFDQIVLDARLDLRRVYAEWWIAARKVEVLEIETDVLGELARRSEERGRVGETSGLEVRRIRLAALETGARAMLARSELATVRAEIGAWRPDLVDAVPPYRPLVPELPPAPKYEPPTRPALAALEAELRASELASALATKPTEMPAVSLGWKRVEPEGAGPSLDGAVVGLTWPVPLPGKGRAERLRAETRRDALEARLDLLRRRFAAELRSAEMSYDQLRGAASEVETALADAEPVVAAARAAFRLGEGDLTTLLDAVRAATEARLAALELQFRALEHQRDLERARGQMFTHPETITQLERDQP